MTEKLPYQNKTSPIPHVYFNELFQHAYKKNTE